MRQMRHGSEENKKKDRARVLHVHLWYKDMVDKLILTGKRDGPSDIETLLIEFIKGYAFISHPEYYSLSPID